MNEKNNPLAALKKIQIDKKKLVIILIAASLIFVTAFLIIWNVTEYDRELNQMIRKTKKNIADFRDGNTDRSYFLPICIFDEYHTDDKFIGFLCSEIQTMCEKGEYNLLHDFVFDIIIYNDIENDQIIDKLVYCFENASSLEQAFGIRDSFDPVTSYTFRYWDKIQPRMVLNRNTSVVAEYINANGTRSFTTVPGEGYYAEYEDTHSKDVIGLPNSPLYDSNSTTYFGDFKCRSWEGVRLNEYFQEVSYGGTAYSFRENAIHFDPTLGECVWSGEYLFCFDKNGAVIGYERITRNI